MSPRKGDYKFDQDLLERLCQATGADKQQMRMWIRALAEGIGHRLPRHGDVIREQIEDR